MVKPSRGMLRPEWGLCVPSRSVHLEPIAIVAIDMGCDVVGMNDVLIDFEPTEAAYASKDAGREAGVHCSQHA